MNVKDHLIRTGQIVGSLAAVALAACMLAACDRPASHQAKPREGAQRSFDLFQGEKLGLVDYAQRRIRNQCMADVGYPQNLQGMGDKPENPFASLVVTPRSLGPTSEEEARRLGFGSDQPAQPVRVVSFDPNFDKAMEECAQKSWEKLGKNSQQTYRSYFALGNSLLSFWAEVDRRRPKDLVPRMFDCMATKNFKSVGTERSLKAGVPAAFGVKEGAVEGGGDAWEPKKVPGTVQVGPPIPARKYSPTAEESGLAVAWYQCSKQTNRFQTMLDLVAQVQGEMVDKHETEFTELNPRLDALARQAADLTRRQ